ncbi:unnamed protein product [Psylliodes chrysocephalus]|uniref:Transposase n=1 Tax=Psylliodes chrysocephalus TaxID=3402493 RepID=A0A9P0CHQ2_9CUCU|nr:unnamed protein product [Psylliodes chrysocephala]
MKLNETNRIIIQVIIGCGEKTRIQKDIIYLMINILTENQNFLISELNRLFPNSNNLWLQQDGAPPHYAVLVRNYLDNVLQNRWIGKRRSIEWPPWSPDLT